MFALPETKNLKWPVWRHEEKFLVTVKCITGAVSMWAIKQSPYSQPDKLPEALDALGKRLVADHTFIAEMFIETTIEGLRVYLEKVFEELPEIRAWNESKLNKDAKYVFTDAYTELNPDYDFIDLGALARNVVHTLGREHFY